MAEYDGAIRIATKITTKDATESLASLEWQIKKSAKYMDELRSKMDTLKEQKVPTKEFEDLQKKLSAAEKEMQKWLAQDSKLIDVDKKIKELSQSSAEYAAKMKEIAERKIPTEAYASIQKQITESEKKLNTLQQKQEKFLATGGKEDSSVYKKMVYDMDLLEKALERLYKASNAYEKKGIAFTSGTDTEQYKNYSAKYEQVNQELEKQKLIHGEIAQKQAESIQKVLELKNQVQQLVLEGKDFMLGKDTEQYKSYERQLQYEEEAVKKASEHYKILLKTSNSYKALGDTAKESLEKINNSVQKSSKSLSSMSLGFKNILKYGFGIRSLYALVNKLRNAIQEGFSNLYNDSNMAGFKNQVDSMKGSLLTLKNSFAAAFRPLVEIAIPYIQKVADALSNLLNMIGQFIAAITGQKTYTKAIKQTTAAIQDQNKAQTKQLSSLDKLNNLTTSSNGSGDDGASQMFEEVPIDSKVLDFLQKIKELLKPVIDYAQKLKDVFMQGFWDGLGDWEYRWESIKDSLKSIKDSLVDIWTDPAVLAAADAWAQSVAYMLGSLAGSLASIGLTIATNLIGGLAKYLEQNKERIKSYLISMFDIWADINYMIAGFFQAFAYIFEAFASEEAQQLTANIIGIHADIFMGITELASKMFRDIANIIIQPFVDNKEAFRIALEGFLGVLAEVTGTIKKGIDDTFDHLNQMYDEHLKPFFDSVAQGLSDLAAQFMEFWNGSVQPLLDEWAVKFDTLWKEHVQPCLDKISDAFGQVADAARELREDVLQPAISWAIENILPKLLPILDTLFDVITTVIGAALDAIGSLISAVADLITFIVKVIKGDWKGAWESAKNVVKNIIDAIKSLISGLVNSISNVASKVKTLFSGISASAKSAVGGGAGSVIGGIIGGNSRTVYSASNPAIASLSSVDFPAYATGQVIPRNMKQHLAILGDNSRETEVVSPLSTIEQAVINAMAKVNGGIGGSNGQALALNLTVECEGYKLLQLIKKLDGEYFKQTGKHAMA